MHYFPGAHLARIELIEALRVLIRRIGNPRRISPVP